MAETDNSEIKDWLKIKSEQKMKRLSSMTINEKEINNYFESREIKPTASIFVYNSVSQKMEFVRGKTVTAEDASVADTHTYTVPMGEYWRLKVAAYNDATTAYNLVVSVVVDGVYCPVYGDFAAIAITTTTVVELKDIVLRPGDSVVVSNPVFVALDAVLSSIAYERVLM